MCGNVFGRKRRLEEPGAALVEPSPEAQRVGEVVGPVRVHGDLQLGVRGGHRVEGGEVLLDPVAEVELDRANALRGPLRGQRGALGVGRLGQPGHVGRDGIAERAAQKSVHG